MDLSKFVWLLTHQQLYFARLDSLADPFEGSVTHKTVSGVAEFLRRLGHPEKIDRVVKMLKSARESVYVNCWCASNSESEAMWRLYCPANLGVAIQSSQCTLAN